MIYEILYYGRFNVSAGSQVHLKSVLFVTIVTF